MNHPENAKEYKGLQVNKGVTSAPTVNPYRRPRPVVRQLTSGEYVEGILKGDVSILGRAVTLIESTAETHQALAQEVIEKCLPFTGNSRRIGITGVPRTKRSILGDKTRMEKLSQQHGAFIRPSPSAGSLGGVARKTRETIVLCEAAGYDNIFVETVGVGQSETAVHSMVDFFLLIQLAGTGDELQGIKRGIMEMADGIVINKADGDNIEHANLAAAQFRNALHLFPPTPSKWVPEVLTYSGYYELGIDKVWDMIDRYFEFVRSTGYFEKKRQEQEKYWMIETIDEQLRHSFYSMPEVKALLEQKEIRVLNSEQSSFTAAKDVLDFYFAQLHKQ